MSGKCTIATQRHRRSGVLTVELALIMPVFILFLFAIMEFGHFCMVSNVLSAAARRGATLGAYEKVTNAEVETRVRSVISSAINANKTTVAIKDGACFDGASFNAATTNYATLPAIDLTTAAAGHCFIVRVTVPYDTVSLLPTFFIKGKTIVGQAATRHE